MCTRFCGNDNIDEDDNVDADSDHIHHDHRHPQTRRTDRALW